MNKASPNKSAKGWKEHLLGSGIPLEYEVARLLAAKDMYVEADFTFLRRDVSGPKECSVDMAATWWGPLYGPPNFELHLLLECMYRSAEQVFLFLDGRKARSPAGLGQTVKTYDHFVPYHLPLDGFSDLEKPLTLAHKAVELHEKGVFEKDLRQAIQKLRYATPALLRRVVDFHLSVPTEQADAVYFSKILVTNASLRLLKKDTDIDMIKAASRIEDVSKEIQTAILFSGYGPDYEDHVRSIFRDDAHERVKAAEAARDNLRSRGKNTSVLFSDPVPLVEQLCRAHRWELHGLWSQFFVTTLAGLPTLLASLKDACEASYGARFTQVPKL